MADLNADRWMADRDRAQTALQAEVDRVFVPGCLANVNNTVDVLAPTAADLIQQAREDGRREGIAEMVTYLADLDAAARGGKASAYTRDADRMGPNRWCRITGWALRIGQGYAAGEGLPVPSAVERAAALEEREGDAHARWARAERDAEDARIVARGLEVVVRALRVAVSGYERDLAAARRREALLAARGKHRATALTAGYPPSGCGWCGRPEKEHSGEWNSGVGFHFFEPADSATILARMRLRRLRRRLTVS